MEIITTPNHINHTRRPVPRYLANYRALFALVAPLVLATLFLYPAPTAVGAESPNAAAVLSTARVFDRPLIWIGDSPPPEAESQALLETLQSVVHN